MAYVRIETRFARHPKALAAGSTGVALWLEGLCYANQYMTDGFLPAVAVQKFRLVRYPMTVARRLVEVGLWESRQKDYLIHDFDQFYASAEVRKAAEKGRPFPLDPVNSSGGGVQGGSTCTSDQGTYVPRRLSSRLPGEDRERTGRTPELGAVAWLLWTEIAAAYGTVVRLTPSPRDLIVCAELARAYAPDELRAVLTAWWSSPYVTSRNLHFFRTQADEVLAHVRSGAALPFRAPQPVAPAPEASLADDPAVQAYRARKAAQKPRGAL